MIFYLSPSASVGSVICCARMSDSFRIHYEQKRILFQKHLQFCLPKIKV